MPEPRFKKIHLRAVARHESFGTYNEICGSCAAMRRDIQQACTDYGIDVRSASKFLKGEIEGIEVMPKFQFHRDRMGEAIELISKTGLPRENALASACNFGLFNLDPCLMLSDQRPIADTVKIIRTMWLNPVSQICAFRLQWSTASKARQGNWLENLLFWRTGDWDRTPHDYAASVERQYFELRNMGHADS